MNIEQIAINYFNERIAKKGPHLMCETATQELYLRLIEKGVQVQKVVFEVDAIFYDGNIECDILEHHCLKIGKKILDVTSGQFKNMPMIYYGSRPIIYK